MNKDYELRDKIIFGGYEKNYYLGGLRSFTGTKEMIQELLDNDFIDPEECQNCSPSVQEFMDAVKDLDNVEFECYSISPERDDYRVTIEGIDIVISDTDFDKVSYAVENFHFADEFSLTHIGNHYHLHAWWD